MGRRDPVPVPPTVRSHIPGYQEYVDTSRCDIRPEPLNNEGPYGHGPDIVKQLSLEWTPAVPGEQDKEHEEEKQDGELDSKIHDGLDFILQNDEQGVVTPPRGRSSSLAYLVTVVESPVQYSQSLDGEGKAAESGKRQDTI